MSYSATAALPSILIAVALSAHWLTRLIRLQRASVRFPELDGSSHGHVETSGAERLSLVVAVKDGEGEIEDCLRTLLAQDYPDYEVVVVNDRSTDATPEILARLEREHPARLRVLSVEQLPAGWGGQNHALHVGVKQSRGALLCFTDADCRFDSPRTLSVAVRELEASRSDLLSLLPEMDAPTVWEKLYLPLCSFLLLLGLRITEVNDPRSDAAYANGAFLLVRRRTYEALGGHERVRAFVNDDIRLSELAKRGGFGLRVAKGSGLCRTRMYPSLRAAFDGWTRNFLGCFEHAPKLAATTLSAFCLCVLPWAGLLVSLALFGGTQQGALLPVVAWFLPLALAQAGLLRLYAAFGVRAGWALFYLPGALFVTLLLGRATLRAVLGRATSWHGVDYPTRPS